MLVLPAPGGRVPVVSASVPVSATELLLIADGIHPDPDCGTAGGFGDVVDCSTRPSVMSAAAAIPAR
jgi:hypothetical protein